MPDNPDFQGVALDCIRGDRMVFTGLSFALSAGDILVLSGPNGSGKSSLLRVMAGLLRPAAGQIRRWGDDIQEDPDGHLAELHYVGHRDAIKPAFSVAENIGFWAGLRGCADAVDVAMAAFNLTSLADVPGRLLSSRQRRRANLARLALAPGGLWLLDEPSVGLDAASTTLLESVIASHRAMGGLTVLSTHTPLKLGETQSLALDDFTPTPVFDEGDLA
jgi:heme exporter protein A